MTSRIQFVRVAVIVAAVISCWLLAWDWGQNDDSVGGTGYRAKRGESHGSDASGEAGTMTEQSIVRSPVLEPDSTPNQMSVRAVTSAGLGLPEATIRLFGSNSTEPMLQALSDQDGIVALPVPDCSMVIAVASVDGLSGALSGTRVIGAVRAGETYDVILRGSATSVVGLVVRDGDPVVGQGVHYSDTMAKYFCATDGAGVFRFSGLYPATGYCWAGESMSKMFSERVFVSKGEATFVLIRLGSSKLVVSTASQGTPIPSIRIGVIPLPFSAESNVRYGTTDSSGKAVFENLPPGRYRVSAGIQSSPTPADSTSQWAVDSKAILVSGLAEAVAFELQKPCVVTLTIRESENEWIASADVYLRVPGKGSFMNPRHPLHFSSAGPAVVYLPPGEVEIVASNSQHGWGMIKVNLLPGEVTERELFLDLSCPQLRINLLGSGSAQVRRVHVFDSEDQLVYLWRKPSYGPFSLDPSQGKENLVLPDSEEDPSLQTLLIPVPAGEYRISCSSGSLVLAEQTLVHSGADLHSVFVESK